MFSGWAGNFFGLTMRSAKGGASVTMVTLPSVTDETSLPTVDHPSESSIVQRPLAHSFAAATDDTSLDVLVHRYLLAAPVLLCIPLDTKKDIWRDAPSSSRPLR